LLRICALRRLTFTTPAIEIGGLEGVEEMEGIVYPFLFDPNENYAPLQEFLAKFKSKYNRTPTFQEAVMYDALRILVAAIEKCKNPEDTECVRDQLYSLRDFPGVTGPTTFNEFGDLLYRQYSWKIYHNGKFVSLREWNPYDLRE
jgi:branched-chain amino acid transport system substrate-binding protein